MSVFKALVGVTSTFFFRANVLNLPEPSQWDAAYPECPNCNGQGVVSAPDEFSPDQDAWHYCTCDYGQFRAKKGQSL